MNVAPDVKQYYLVSMEISSVDASDEGEYKAVAKNAHGEGVATINLNFEGSGKPKYFEMNQKLFFKNLNQNLIIFKGSQRERRRASQRNRPSNKKVTNSSWNAFWRRIRARKSLGSKATRSSPTVRA